MQHQHSEPRNLEELVEQINVVVSQMVTEFIQTHLNTRILQLAEETNIPVEKLHNNINLEPSLYQVIECQAKTVLGNPCKYKAVAGNIYCVKHSKKQITNNNKDPTRSEEEAITDTTTIKHEQVGSSHSFS